MLSIILLISFAENGVLRKTLETGSLNQCCQGTIIISTNTKLISIKYCHQGVFAIPSTWLPFITLLLWTACIMMLALKEVWNDQTMINKEKHPLSSPASKHSCSIYCMSNENSLFSETLFCFISLWSQCFSLLSFIKSAHAHHPLRVVLLQSLSLRGPSTSALTFFSVPFLALPSLSSSLKHAFSLPFTWLNHCGVLSCFP